MKGVFVSYSYYGTLHLSENGMFAFRANLTAGLCPLLALGGVSDFSRTFRRFCRQDLYCHYGYFIIVSVLIAMKSDQLNLPTGQVEHSQQHCGCSCLTLWMNGQITMNLV